MPRQIFGSGFLIATPLVTSGVATPRQFAQLQDVSVDESFESKPLYGNNKFPLAVAQGKGKIDIKAKMALVDPKAYAQIFNLGTLTTSAGEALSFNELFSVPPASGPYTYTAANAGSAGVNFVEDYGVQYVAGGLQLDKVASGPTVGQYSVSSLGVYTFSASDAGVAMQVSYRYATTTGFVNKVTNTLLGQQTFFEMILSSTGPTGQLLRRFPSCLSTKLSRSTKQDDWMIPEMDISAFADVNGNVYFDSGSAAS